jgi:hypothetical protein
MTSSLTNIPNSYAQRTKNVGMERAECLSCKHQFSVMFNKDTVEYKATIRGHFYIREDVNCPVCSSLDVAWIDFDGVNNKYHERL